MMMTTLGNCRPITTPEDLEPTVLAMFSQRSLKWRYSAAKFLNFYIFNFLLLKYFSEV